MTATREEIKQWCEANLFGCRRVGDIPIPLNQTQNALLQVFLDAINRWENRPPTQQTADGHPLKVGDSVWLRPSVMDPKEEPRQRVVGTIRDHVIDFQEVIDGCFGAKKRWVFHEREKAFWDRKALLDTRLFSVDELDKICPE